MGDVGERPRVDDGRAALGRLHQVGLERVAQHRRHRSGGADVARGDHRAAVGRPDHDAGEARLEIRGPARQRDDRHDLARGGDVEALLPREAVELAAEADDDVAEGAIVHVERAPPRHLARIDVALFAELRREVAGVVDHRREQVVRGGDGVDVAREVEVDVVGGHERRSAAAGAAALHAEHRAERGLAQAEGDALAEAAHAHRHPDRRRRLALAGRRGVDRRHEDEPARSAR